MNRIIDRRVLLGAAMACWISLICSPAQAQSDPLPSWNDSATKKSITDFISRVTTQGSTDFVPLAERIAVFDNDGTLWSEQPIYFQFAFAVDRLKTLAPKHSEWKDKSVFKAVIDGDMKGALAGGEKGLLEVLAVSHSGMTTEEFARAVEEWTVSARHPRFNRPYIEIIYQPMLELMNYLRANGFKTFIVSGGGVEFIRVFAEKVYGIPPEQVVGSSGVVKFGRAADGKVSLIKEPKVEFIDDHAGKPVGINRFIGRRPILAFGNSDGDHEMLHTPRPALVRASWASSITQTPSANGLMIVNRISTSSTKPSTRAMPWAGLSST